jgi:hypothetical protein
MNHALLESSLKWKKILFINTKLIDKFFYFKSEDNIFNIEKFSNIAFTSYHYHSNSEDNDKHVLLCCSNKEILASSSELIYERFYLGKPLPLTQNFVACLCDTINNQQIKLKKETFGYSIEVTHKVFELIQNFDDFKINTEEDRKQLIEYCKKYVYSENTQIKVKVRNLLVEDYVNLLLEEINE